jgi:hypothetical protein
VALEGQEDRSNAINGSITEALHTRRIDHHWKHVDVVIWYVESEMVLVNGTKISIKLLQTQNKDIYANISAILKHFSSQLA